MCKQISGREVRAFLHTGAQSVQHSTNDREQLIFDCMVSCVLPESCAGRSHSTLCLRGRSGDKRPDTLWIHLASPFRLPPICLKSKGVGRLAFLYSSYASVNQWSTTYTSCFSVFFQFGTFQSSGIGMACTISCKRLL